MRLLKGLIAGEELQGAVDPAEELPGSLEEPLTRQRSTRCCHTYSITPDFEFGMTHAFSGQTDGTSATQMARKPCLEGQNQRSCSHIAKPEAS